MVLLHVLQKRASLGKIASLHKFFQSFERIVLADISFLRLRLRLRVQMGCHDSEKRLHDPCRIACSAKSTEAERIATFPCLKLIAKSDFDGTLVNTSPDGDIKRRIRRDSPYSSAQTLGLGFALEASQRASSGSAIIRVHVRQGLVRCYLV
jgi:hypothetical protein